MLQGFHRAIKRQKLYIDHIFKGKSSIYKKICQEIFYFFNTFFEKYVKKLFARKYISHQSPL